MSAVSSASNFTRELPWFSAANQTQSMYSVDYATFEDDTVYSQKDAEGFIRLNALRLRIQKMLRTGNN